MVVFKTGAHGDNMGHQDEDHFAEDFLISILQKMVVFKTGARSPRYEDHFAKGIFIHCAVVEYGGE